MSMTSTESFQVSFFFLGGGVKGFRDAFMGFWGLGFKGFKGFKGV